MYFYLHTHWDREWYATAATYRLRLCQVLADLLNRLETGQLSQFTLDGQTVLLEDYINLFPAEQPRIQALVAAGKLHVGPWYTAPDEWLVSGESLIRNLQRGIQQSVAWGQPANSHTLTAYLPDTFGHSGCMPTLMSHMGLKSALVWRGVAAQKTPVHFNWQGPDGSTLHTLHLRQGYFHPFLHDPNLTLEEKHQALETLLTQLSTESIPPLLPIGGDHLGILSQEAFELLETTLPQAQQVSPAGYFATLPEPHHLHTGLLMDNADAYLLTGVWSARPYLKQQNRACEHALLHQIEPLLITAWPKLTETQRQQMTCHTDTAWQQLLLNHPHDSICGCSLDEVHAENEIRFQQVLDIAHGVRKQLWQVLTHPSEKSFTLWHGGSQPYTGVVAVEAILNDQPPDLPGVQWFHSQTILQNGYETDPCQIPLSHLTIQRHTGWLWVDSAPPMAFTSQNGHTPSPAPVTISENNGVTCIQNSLAGLQYHHDGLAMLDVQGHATTFQLLWQPDEGDSYNRGPALEATEVWGQFISAAVTISGPLVAEITTRWQLAYQGHTTCLDISFRVMAASPVILIHVAWETPWPNGLLQWVVETGQPVKGLWTESHLGTQHWPIASDFNLAHHLPAAPQKEVLPQSAAMQRWCWVNGHPHGHLILTDGPPEIECVGHQLRHSLLRTFDGISHGKTTTRGGPAGPPFATPGGQYPGRPFTCTVGWSPQPQQNIPLAMALADIFYTHLNPAFSAQYGVKASDTGSLAQWHNPNIHRVATQPWTTENQTGWLLRLVNLAETEQTATLTFGCTAAQGQVVNGLNEPIHDLKNEQSNRGTLTYTWRPGELMTLRVTTEQRGR